MEGLKINVGKTINVKENTAGQTEREGLERPAGGPSEKGNS